MKKEMSLQKESEWENQTCEVRWTEHGNFRVVCGAPYPCSTHTSKEERKKWITGIVSQREKEIAEEVAEIQTQLHNGRFEEGYKLTNKLLSLLKH